jgi:hypothetical protein
MKKTKNKLKRKHLKKKLVLAFRKAFTSKGEGIARMNGII